MKFDDLVHQHSEEIHAYLWRMLRDKHDAEDCLQEVFLKAYGAFSRLRPNSNHRAWLYKIAGNTAKNHLKKASNHREIHQLPDGLWSASEELDESEQLLQELYAAVHRLPFKQRASLLMRKYQELSYDEISEILSCSPEAARANVYQALKKLRRKFVPEEEIG